MAAKKRRASKKGKSHALGVIMAGTATAAAIGAYYFYGPKGKQHRKKIKAWSLKAKSEVLGQVEGLKNIDRVKYNALVDRVSNKYKRVKNINASDVESLKRDLKAQWNSLEENMKTRAPKAKKAVKKAVRKVKRATKKGTAKKTTKKTAHRTKKTRKTSKRT